MYYETNIYKCSLLSKWINILIITISFILIAVFTALAEVAPQIITFSDIVDDTKCQNELNVQQITGSQQEFRDILNNNLLCYFCQENIEEQPFGIKGILTNQQTIVNQTALTYSIGYFDEQTKHSCWYDAAQNENILQLPKIISNIYGKTTKVSNVRILLNWECIQNKTTYTCYTKENIFSSNEAYSRLFGFILIEGIQYDYMNFAIMKQSKDYYSYNEVMMIVWVGIQLVFSCVLCMLEDEFESEHDKILIPTISKRNYLFFIFCLNNHPLFLIQLFYDDLYLKLINVIFQSLAQGGFLFYATFVLQRILRIQKNYGLIVNIILCIIYSTIKSFITIVTGLDMMKNIPESSIFINKTHFNYLGLFMVIWYTSFLILNIILFIQNKKNKQIQLKQTRNDTNLKLVYKYFKGIFLYQIFSLLFISGFFIRILWQNLVSFNPNYLYYDHYQITLINVWIISLFIYFYPQNPNSITQILDEDDEEIDYKMEFQLCNTIQLEEEQVKLQEPAAEQLQEVGSKTLDTNLRKVKYNDIAQPETQLRN